VLNDTSGIAPKFLSVAQCATSLGISKITVYRHVEEGVIPSIKVGGRRLIPYRVIENLEALALNQEVDQ